MADLRALGWNDSLAAAFAAVAAPGVVPGRVIQQRGLYGVATGQGDYLAVVSGRFRHAAAGPIDYPAVGDWVALRPAKGHGQSQIQAVLPRRSCFSRKVAGRRVDEQVVAANVDTVFLVSGLDGDFNPRRIERYVAAAWESGARPVVVLNKADQSDDPEERRHEAESVALSVPVHAVSALEGTGLAALSEYLRPGETVALLGSSGAGKSTLINRLLGAEVQRTREVLEADDRGRHTTTHRELFVAPGGWLLVDTPGMRELQLWEGEVGFEATFADVEEIAEGCAFRDCRHQGEPGCAVAEAVAEGRLAPERLASYHKLQRELDTVKAQADVAARIRDKQRLKAAHKAHDRHKPRR